MTRNIEGMYREIDDLQRKDKKYQQLMKEHEDELATLDQRNNDLFDKIKQNYQKRRDLQQDIVTRTRNR